MRRTAAVGATALLAACGGMFGRGGPPSPSAAPLLSCAVTEVAARGYTVVATPRDIEDGFTAEKFFPPTDTDTRTRGILLVSASRHDDGYRLSVQSQRYAEGKGPTQAIGRPRPAPGGPIPLPPNNPVTGTRVPGDGRGPATVTSWNQIGAGLVGRDAALVREACRDGVPDGAPPAAATGLSISPS